jgi:hypothetical protein
MLRSAYLALFLAGSLAVARAEEPSAAIPAPEVENGALKLGFDRLAGYKFIAPDFDPAADSKSAPPTGESQIPEIVKSWSGKKVVVTGFMLPTKIDNGKTTEFLLMANQMACCFGSVPNMNDWVVVRIPKGTAVIQDVPISFRGTFKVGAMFENRYMTGIYELQAEGDGVVKE